MNKPKDAPPASGMLRKVAKFVANPTTDWSKLSTTGEEAQQLEADKAELRAMLERKRRNDFVRRREFDMLRRVRREGLSPEQAAAIDRSSRLDDTEGRGSEVPSSNRRGVKDKIDAIEQQMVGASAAPRPAPKPAPQRDADEGATLPMALVESMGKRPPPAPLAMSSRPADAAGVTLEPLEFRVSEPAPPPMPRADLILPDPVMDEAVIAFANAEFGVADSALEALTSGDSPRRLHPDTWLARFDLYRATGQHTRFESLALDFATLFSRSAPQWISLPQRVADATQEEPGRQAGQGEVGWSCPNVLDAEGVARLRSQALQWPQPWVFDWSPLERLDVQGANELYNLLKSWAMEPHTMRWLGADRLMGVLQEHAPTGVRDTDPAYWMLRLEVLRAANRPDQFDEVAIDYCMTFEVSPPSWETARCTVRLGGGSSGSRLTSLSLAGDVVTSFLDSSPVEDGGAKPAEVAVIELSGQLVGDLSATLRKLDEQIGSARVIHVACGRLIRVDFIAAGDLLNWVIARRESGLQVVLLEVHRMVGLFFGAMGLCDHAQLRALPG